MQILTVEVIMKRQVSICIFLSIIVIVLALLYIKTTNKIKSEESKQEQETNMSEFELPEDPSVTISQQHIGFYFYAKDDEGRVSVYDIKSQTLYMETGIETFSLPLDIQEQLKEGIYFKNEIELFDFLENYSS